MRVPDGLMSSSGLMVLRMHSDMDHSHTLPYFSAKYVSYSETAGGSKGQFTPSESEKDQRMNDRRQRKISLSLLLSLGVNGPVHKGTINITEGLFTDNGIEGESENGTYIFVSHQMSAMSIRKLLQNSFPKRLRIRFCSV